ncbi:MAG: PTS sugar transporter subunit IIA [Phycisphaerae bacterium]|jgi:mannitol/fructose-specific phosphotransferase system IIA component (Ntr-type)|nr:PTS sugar transporter subunit IIA [Phycisphaerae bacterium]
MKLSDFFVPEAVIPELKATDRNGVIRELTASLAAAVGMDEAQAAAISKAVIARENQGSTGFGKGVAVPHVKHPAVKRIMATLGRSSTGVDFAALDRAPVYIVVLLLSPPDNPDQHLASMENIFRHLQRDNFRRFLRQASTKEEINENIREADELPGG